MDIRIYTEIDTEMKSFHTKNMIQAIVDTSIAFFPPGREFTEIDYDSIINFYIKALNSVEY